jgi:hypothetical protein
MLLSTNWHESARYRFFSTLRPGAQRKGHFYPRHIPAHHHRPVMSNRCTVDPRSMVKLTMLFKFFSALLDEEKNNHSVYCTIATSGVHHMHN